MKILVLGDRIEDKYTWGVAKRLCPESCAPVLHVKGQSLTGGGAELVYEQIKALIGVDSVIKFFGSISNKHRIFADRTLICRIDNDSIFVMDQLEYLKEISHRLELKIDAVVVGDYGKGAMGRPLAVWLTQQCREKNIPLFVDAKSDPTPYAGCFAIFPNEFEHVHISHYQHVIQKLGEKGCVLDDYPITTDKRQVYDVTGAGDIFLAAFVVEYLRNSGPEALMEAACFANRVAGISVQHLGTYVVPLKEIDDKHYSAVG